MSSENLYLIANVCKSKLALPVQHVLEIVSMPPVRSICNGDAKLRGVINLRGKIMPVLDLRVVLGMPSMVQEVEQTCQMLQQRAQDHIKWVDELEACISTGRPFKLARDPHLCAFGKWFYAFKTTDRQLTDMLRQLESPHAQIHALADELLTLASAGQRDEALTRIHAARTGKLQAVLQLLKATEDAVRRSTTDLAVVIEDSDRDRTAAVSIDAVDNIEQIAEDAVVPLEMGRGCTQLTPHTARLKGSKSLALVINADYLTALASRAA